MKHLIVSAVFVLGAATPSYSSVLQNGMFDDGLTGWTPRADTNFNSDGSSGASAHYIDVQKNDENSYARLISDPDADSFVTFVTLSQAFHVPSSAPVLSFDYGLLSDVANSVNPPGADELAANVDYFQVRITDKDADGNISDPGDYILVDRTSASVSGNPSQSTITNNPGSSPIGNGVLLDLVTRDASDPLFDTTVSVDLTKLIGRDLSIQFLIRDYFDGRQTAYAVDNIAFSEASTVIPENAVIPLPASMWFLAAGIGALGVARYRRAS